MTPDFAKLGKRLRKGDQSAFVELYDFLGERMFRYFYAQVRSSDDAADLVQETFIQLVKSHRKLGQANNLNAYVFTSARNELIRWLKRKDKTRAETNLADVEATAKIEHEMESDEWINTTLNRLDPTDKDIVQLKVFGNLTFDEIANVTKMKTSTVATRYRRAIGKLESCLNPEEVKQKS